MTSVCCDCGERISLGRRLLGRDRCSTCQTAIDEARMAEQERMRAQREADMAAFAEVLDQLVYGVDLDVVLPRIERARQLTPLDATDVDEMCVDARAQWIDGALADGLLTHEEDTALARIQNSLGITAGLATDLWHEFVIGAVNAGLLPTDPDPVILLNAGEHAVQKFSAGLLSKKVITEYRLDYNSVSIPLGKSGVRYRTGSARGRTVEVGTRVEVADTGWLTITSQRVVFAGGAQSMEFPLKRVLGVRLFEDGIGLQIANRQSVPTFRTGRGANEVFAAVLSTVVGQDRGTFVKPVADAMPVVAPGPVPELLASAGYADTSAVLAAPIDRADEPDDSAERERLIAQFEKTLTCRDQIPTIVTAVRSKLISVTQFRDMIAGLEKLARDAGLPPSLIPFASGDEPAIDTRELADDDGAAARACAALTAIGFTEQQRERFLVDYRAGLVPPGVLSLVESTVEDDDSEAVPAVVDPSHGDDTAVRVFERAGEGSRSRELLKILADESRAMTPTQIAERMRSDDGPVATSTVRAAIRNVSRIQKSALEQRLIQRSVLIVDGSNYATDGANRYSLLAEDCAAIRRATGAGDTAAPDGAAALGLRPEVFEAVRAGLAARVAGNLTEAYDSFARASQLDTDDRTAYEDLAAATCAGITGDSARVIEHLERAARFTGEWPDALAKLGRSLGTLNLRLNGGFQREVTIDPLGAALAVHQQRNYVDKDPAAAGEILEPWATSSELAGAVYLCCLADCERWDDLFAAAQRIPEDHDAGARAVIVMVQAAALQTLQRNADALALLQRHPEVAECDEGSVADHYRAQLEALA